MMDLKNLLEDDAGVSPVIGVILMVAITVILAAVIGTFVLNNNNLNNTAPQVNWDYESTSGDEVKVTHQGGDDVEVDNLDVSGAVSGDLSANSDATSGNTLSAGSQFTTSSSGSFTSGTTLRIIWTSPEGGSSSTIGEYEVP